MGGKDVLKILGKRGVDRKTLELIVKFDPKGRFEIEDERIRAKYGHSIDVFTDWSEGGRAEKLYHGTSPINLESILKEGLKPMKRREVHLTERFEEAILVGRRHHPDSVILEVDTECLKKKVRKKGSVYTTDFVPPE